MDTYAGIQLAIIGGGALLIAGIVIRQIFFAGRNPDTQEGPRIDDPAELKELNAIHGRLQRLADRTENAGDSSGARAVRKSAAKILLLPVLAQARAKEAEIQNQMEMRLRNPKNTVHSEREDTLDFDLGSAIPLAQSAPSSFSSRTDDS